ncbi:hypothetical protein DICVIV_09347 [Dictyocaulus viviparus]|uniref:Tetratricopeptide repeat protein n=1 Tax=Dictyocaulus viviparus TaxID=29172 RepID=A0A0D8XQH8_DICVI|nr:hypothetical protein DICVIV_09347 [Dictyocaulus viviparus]
MANVITCAKCGNVVPKEYVMTAYRAMRFIDKVIENRELDQNMIPLIPPDNNEELLQLHLRAERCVRQCFPSNHPAVALHLRNIGTFLNNLSRYEDAEKYLRESLEIMEFALDSDHSMTIDCRKMLEQIPKKADDAVPEAIQASVSITDNPGHVSNAALMNKSRIVENTRESGNNFVGVDSSNVMESPINVSHVDTQDNNSTDFISDDHSDLPDLLI